MQQTTHSQRSYSSPRPAEPHVPRCGDHTVLSIAAHCSQFSSLLATHVLRLTDNTLLALVRGCTHLTKVVSGSAMAADITELSLFALAECGPACLRSLCLWCSLDVTDATQQLLRERCPLLQLDLMRKVASS
jgi:hypothetical protein